jgi:alkanesulfonate monooxygenase SsuD/methylene tetrahydromethanopterin reductase-like flavin-dependent oxidoreductase (luciferase family)
MKFTLRLPIDLVEPVGEFQTPDAARDIAMAVEQAGFDAAFLTEHPAPTAEWLAVGHDALDPMVALAFVAAATTRLKVHTNLVVLPYRNPFLLASSRRWGSIPPAAAPWPTTRWRRCGRSGPAGR